MIEEGKPMTKRAGSTPSGTDGTAQECPACVEQRALGGDAPKTCFVCWTNSLVVQDQEFINQLQQDHDAHKERCSLCRVTDYCVVAQARRRVLDAWNE